MQSHRREPQNDEATFLNMDFREEDALKNAGANIDNYITIGRNSLEELYKQRSIIKVRPY